MQQYRERKGREAAFLGTQRGATGSKHAIEAVVGFGLDADTHYERALKVSEAGCDPWNGRGIAEPDLRYSAIRTVQNAKSIRRYRQHVEGLIKELAGRVRRSNVALRKRQKGHIRKVAGKLSIGLIATC